MRKGLTVWVLGAGFSRPLGAPTLQELFRERLPEDLETMFGSFSDLPACLYQVQAIYAAGLRDGIWHDPEECLEVLDAAPAEAGLGLSGRIVRLLSEFSKRQIPRFRMWSTLPELARAARRAMAAECSYFLLGADISSERWLPYRLWFDALKPESDVVVTFNYDLVLERLRGDREGYQIVLPGDKQRAGRVPIFKLHGSVDWRAYSTGIGAAEVADLLSNAEEEISICTPGPRKHELAAALFADLWEKALAHFAETRRVVFLGYRFPPSDASSRIKLLTAISRRSLLDGLELQVVLGPPSPTTLRMQCLLETAVQGSRIRIVIQPLWAEDFLSMAGIPK